MKRAILAALPGVLVLSLIASGCRRAAAPEEASSDARRFAIRGVVRKVDRGRSEVTLEHGDIPGYMGAMTMAFPVRGGPDALDRLAEGARVAGTLVVDGERYWLEGLAPAAAAPASGGTGSAPSAAVTPVPNRGVGPGDPVPDFALTDQTGRTVRLSQLRGDPVAVTFLYTRCPIATACPMTAAKFSKLDAMLAEKRFGTLLTITVDPEHDTPAVFADYAKKLGADVKRWKFLSGDPKDVAADASSFGVLYYVERGQVIHSQAVAVVDAVGRLASIYYGENWEPDHLVRDMEKARSG